jgi:hypothetical protein
MNRLTQIRLSNPLYANTSDEDFLNYTHKKYYGNWDFDKYRERMTRPQTLKELNDYVIQSVPSRKDLEGTEGYNDYSADLFYSASEEKKREWDRKGTIDMSEAWEKLSLLNCTSLASDHRGVRG